MRNMLWISFGIHFILFISKTVKSLTRKRIKKPESRLISSMKCVVNKIPNYHSLFCWWLNKRSTLKGWIQIRSYCHFQRMAFVFLLSLRTYFRFDQFDYNIYGLFWISCSIFRCQLQVTIASDVWSTATVNNPEI